VIPAHNEEAGIATTVRSCLDVEYPAERVQVVVIADNCTDGTAEVALVAGANVIERADPQRKSKGFAIEYLIGELRSTGNIDAIDALVIVDADSTVSRNLLQVFADMLKRGHDWVQSLYIVANPDDSWRTRLMAYAFYLFNGVTPLGQFALGRSAGFRGNGMCLSTRGMKRVPWICHGLVEDFEYSWTVRMHGERVAFAPEGVVRALFPDREGVAAVSQRSRWEFGRKELRKRFFLPLLRLRKLAFLEWLNSLIELSMPPMMEFMLLLFLIQAASQWALSGDGPPPQPIVVGFLLSMFALSCLTVLVHAVSPFIVFRLPWKYLSAMLHLPSYALWKLGVLSRGRPHRWVPTREDSQMLESNRVCGQGRP
jgi:glycosyltransferase involved in cell wall biosynthesis